jgi:uncharacterized membrane protein (UPF0127 family)
LDFWAEGFPMRATRMLGLITQRASPPQSIDTVSSDDVLDIVRSVNVTRGTVIADRVVWATGAAKRRGLLGRTHLDMHEGMYLVPCQWIHMFGMRFPIDVAFLGRDGRVLAVHHALPPNRLSRLVLRAEGVLELAAGALRASGTCVGDVVELQDV